jgi:hypothetical protein
MDNSITLRWWRHLTMTRGRMRRAFSPTLLDAVAAQVRASEQLHGGEIRVAIEAELSTLALLKGQSPRERAIEVFAALHVWDTQARNGVVIYLCLADRAVEIVADRGFAGRVSAPEWSAVCRQLEAACAARCYEAGVCEAVLAVGKLIGRHYPHADRNEQDDRPVLL